MIWNGGENNHVNIIVSRLQETPSKEFLEKLKQKRIELISSIVYRVLSNKE